MIDVLEKIQIRGFGANKKLDIDFSPNVTSIIGKSFEGKSWALRALRWVLLNKPAGDAYINWDSDEAKVRLSIDKKKVIRTRSKSVNSYKLSGKKEPYVAFGNDVPRDIAELVNVSDKINFQTQHILPFWFCETAGEVSRQLNSIVNLEVIDSTLANIATEIRDTGTIIKLTEKALKEAVQEKKDLLYVRELDSDLKGVEKLNEQYRENAEKRSTIDQKLNLVAKYVSIRENLANQASDGLKTMSVGRKYSEIADSVEKLLGLVESAESLQSVLDNRPPSIKSLEKLKEKNELIANQVDELDDLIEKIESRSQEKCLMEEMLKSLTKELEEIAEGRCPLCGAKMKKS